MYLPAVAGVGFSSHYCWGELKETNIFSVEKQSCCCSDDAEEANGCCSDDITVIKLDKDQLSAENRQPVKPQVTDLFISSEVFSAATATAASTEVKRQGLFPDLPGQLLSLDLNVLYCNFLI